MRIQILEHAERDLIEGFHFYESQGLGLGSYEKQQAQIQAQHKSEGCVSSRERERQIVALVLF